MVYNVPKIDVIAAIAERRASPTGDYFACWPAAVPKLVHFTPRDNVMVIKFTYDQSWRDVGRQTLAAEGVWVVRQEVGFISKVALHTDTLKEKLLLAAEWAKTEAGSANCPKVRFNIAAIRLLLRCTNVDIVLREERPRAP